MTSKNVPPWQNVLDSLTNKSKEWNLFTPTTVGKKKEIDIVQKCFRLGDLRSYLIEWMDLCLTNAPKKSATESTALRAKGNEEFKRHHDWSSLSLYTDCVRYAPYGSEQHAVGLANRSAVLLHLKKYKECIKDTEKALSLPYPTRLKLKLMLRQARCYLNLKDWKNCQTVLQLCENESSTGPSAEGSKQEIQSIKVELNKMQNCTPSKSITEMSENTLPLLLMGPNSDLPFASAALELKYSDRKGRYIVTTEDVEQGDVLFMERPYAFVVLPEQYKVHCHHCSRSLLAPVPCRNCVEALFCDESCEMASRESYHHWECGGISLMSAIGIAHLGVRIVLTTGSPSKILERARVASLRIQSTEGSFGSLEDSYTAVYSLLPHVEDMSPDDLFQYTATAELLSLFLLHKTDYFKTVEKCDAESEVFISVGSLLLRHIAQLVCNAHAITKLDSDRNSPPISEYMSSVVSESQQRIATAIYPSASMMNHSCDPNIINSFSTEVLIVKASRKIPKGEEVFNCYGPHFQRMGTAERQAALQAQYFFFCDCSACVSNPGESFDPIQERLWALRCSSCSGPLLNEAPGREPAGSKVAQSDATNSHLMVCGTCGSHQPISSLVRDAFSALSIFKQGCEYMDDGHMQCALRTLNQCKELQERALYRSNKGLTATYDMLAKCYATLGHYNKSADFLELMLPAVEEQYGANSIEVANELQKLSDVMLCSIRTMEITPSQDLLDKVSKVIERALSILSVHYGMWNQGWQDLVKKKLELKLMSEMASVQGDMKLKMTL